MHQHLAAPAAAPPLAAARAAGLSRRRRACSGLGDGRGRYSSPWGVPQPHHPDHSRTADQSSSPCLPLPLSNSPALHSTPCITPAPTLPCPCLCPYAALPLCRPASAPAPAHSLGLHQLVVPKLCKERLEQALVGYQEPLPAALEQVLEGDACREAARSGGAAVARTSVRQEGGPWCAGGTAGCRGNCAAGGRAGTHAGSVQGGCQPGVLTLLPRVVQLRARYELEHLPGAVGQGGQHHRGALLAALLAAAHEHGGDGCRRGGAQWKGRWVMRAGQGGVGVAVCSAGERVSRAGAAACARHSPDTASHAQAAASRLAQQSAAHLSCSPPLPCPALPSSHLQSPLPGSRECSRWRCATPSRSGPASAGPTAALR